MNPVEAARFLGVPEATLQRWVRQGLLVGAAPDGSRFDPERLRAWAESRGIRPRGERPVIPGPEENLLSGAVARGAVCVGRDLKTASEAIALALDAIPTLPADAKRVLLEAVLDRERMAATGMGQGVAVPHPRKPPGNLVREPLVSVVFVDPLLDWAALDGERVHSVFLLLSPNAPSHLELLSRLAFAVRSEGFLAALKGRPDHGALVDRLRLLKRNR